ncbi:MAG: GAF domain-containing protein, partial [Synechococcales cyanobacterium T60_A2020_003]|nr:GAF domain-containing protein [Synechococcales cyanobacterium T60_A2020_003]
MRDPVALASDAFPDPVESQAGCDRLLANILQRIRFSLELPRTFKSIVTEVQTFLACDRVVIYRFNSDWSGSVVAESVRHSFTALMGQVICDPCFAENLVEPYRNGRIQVTSNVNHSQLSECHIRLLKSIQVQALIVVPVLHGDQLWGLLAAHHCAAPRDWQSSEVEVLQRISAQVAIAIQQSELYHQAQTELQERLQIEAELKQATQKQFVIAEMGQRALESNNLDQTLSDIVEVIASTLRVSHVCVLELLPNQAALLLRAGKGWKNGWVGQARVSASGQSQAGYTLAIAQPVIVDDLRTETRFSGTPFLHNAGIVSGISLPIQGKHFPYGVLSIHSKTARHFGRDDLNFLQAVANIISSVVKRQQTEAELSQFFNLSLDLLCIAGADGFFKRVNPQFQAVLGYSESELYERPILDFVYPDDRAITQRQLTLLADGVPVVDFHNRYLDRDGTYHWFSWMATPTDDGLIYAVARDITEQKEAEDALQKMNEELERRVAQRTIALQQQVDREKLMNNLTQRIRESLDLSAILNTAVLEIRKILIADRVLVIRMRADQPGMAIAEAREADYASALHQSLSFLCTPQDYDVYAKGDARSHDDLASLALPEAIADEIKTYEIRSAIAIPILQRDELWGLLVAHQCSYLRRWTLQEITILQQIAEQLAIATQQSELYEQLQIQLCERQQVEEAMRTSLREKEVLLKEIHHRVKNNLLVVTSLLELQSDHTNHPMLSKLLLDSQNRIHSMALIHEKLYRTSSLNRINAKDYLQDLAEHVFESYHPQGQEIHLHCAIAPIELNIETANPCGLIVNELLSNALKHAFSDRSTGHVKLSLQPMDSQTLLLTVQDDGIGFPEDLKLGHIDSLGMELVYTLTQQLEGTLEL